MASITTLAVVDVDRKLRLLSWNGEKPKTGKYSWKSNPDKVAFVCCVGQAGPGKSMVVNKMVTDLGTEHKIQVPETFGESNGISIMVNPAVAALDESKTPVAVYFTDISVSENGSDPQVLRTIEYACAVSSVMVFLVTDASLPELHKIADNLRSSSHFNATAWVVLILPEMEFIEAELTPKLVEANEFFKTANWTHQRVVDAARLVGKIKEVFKRTYISAESERTTGTNSRPSKPGILQQCLTVPFVHDSVTANYGNVSDLLEKVASKFKSVKNSELQKPIERIPSGSKPTPKKRGTSVPAPGNVSKSLDDSGIDLDSPSPLQRSPSSSSNSPIPLVDKALRSDSAAGVNLDLMLRHELLGIELQMALMMHSVKTLPNSNQLQIMSKISPETREEVSKLSEERAQVFIEEIEKFQEDCRKIVSEVSSSHFKLSEMLENLGLIEPKMVAKIVKEIQEGVAGYVPQSKSQEWALKNLYKAGMMRCLEAFRMQNQLAEEKVALGAEKTVAHVVQSYKDFMESAVEKYFFSSQNFDNFNKAVRKSLMKAMTSGNFKYTYVWKKYSVILADQLDELGKVYAKKSAERCKVIEAKRKRVLDTCVRIYIACAVSNKNEAETTALEVFEALCHGQDSSLTEIWKEELIKATASAASYNYNHIPDQRRQEAGQPKSTKSDKRQENQTILAKLIEEVKDILAENPSLPSAVATYIHESVEESVELLERITDLNFALQNAVPKLKAVLEHLSKAEFEI